MHNSIFFTRLRTLLENTLQYPVLVGKIGELKSNCILLDCSIENGSFDIDLIFIPRSRRGLGYTAKIIRVLSKVLPNFGVTEIVVFPFPSDFEDSKKQKCASINKLVKFYSRLGFKLDDSVAFYSYFKTPKGYINYNEQVYYDDLCGCNKMILPLSS